MRFKITTLLNDGKAEAPPMEVSVYDMTREDRMSGYTPSFREAMNEAALDDSPVPTPSYVEALESVQDDGCEGARAEQIAFIARMWELPVDRIQDDLTKIERNR